jgi:hypothetical protein
MLDFLRYGSGPYSGLETVDSESGPSGWTKAVKEVFPQARYFHKAGLISNYALDAAYVDDSAHSGKRYIFVAAVHAGYASEPVQGEPLVGEMARAIALWVKNRPSP